MEIRDDLSAWQHSALHSCHDNTEHNGLETGYCLILFDFYLRDAMLARYLPSSRVCPSVCHKSVFY